MTKKPTIAIIGSGISGLAAAYFLREKYDVKIFEKNDYLGGHSNTISVDYNGKKIAVDTGFIVFNHQTYPNLVQFFHHLQVIYQKSLMSFAVKIDEGKLEYAGTNLATVFAQPKNLFDVKFLRMLRDITLFNKRAIEVLARPFDENYTLKQLLDELGVKDYFRQFYLLPMSGAIWSCPLETMLSYPAQSFVQFFKNHGLLTVANQPQWQTVTGGSIEYVKKIAAAIGQKNISLNDEVLSVERQADGKVLVNSKKSAAQTFDHALLALHGCDVLKILKNPSKQEQQVFNNFRYQPNLAVLHRDESVMPNANRAWSSWVYSKNSNSKDGQISVTYWMNNLQDISDDYPLFVTLNPNCAIAEDKIFAKINYQHPVFDSGAVKAQSQIAELQGDGGIYFCGAYQKFGFHEDGISSALAAINKLNVFAPWQ